MVYPFSRLVVSIQRASSDGLFYARYPHGDKPAVTSLTGAAVSQALAGGALSTGIHLAGAAADSISANANLTTGSGGAPIVFDRFISTTGSNSNDGMTAATAWAITALQDTNAHNAGLAGLKIGLVAGTYDLSALQSGSQPGDNEHPILHLPPGSSGSPTYVASCDSSGNYSPRVAILDWGTNASSNSMIGQNPDLGGWWTVDGLGFIGSTSAASAKRIGYYQSGSSAGPATIQNCDFGAQTVGSAANGSNDGAIFEDGPIGTVVFNNNFHDIHKPGQPDHVHAYCGFHTVGTQFIQNTVVACDTAMDGKVNCQGATVKANYFYNNGTANTSSAVIQGFDGDQIPAGMTVQPATFLNNIFDSNPGPIREVDVSTRICQPNTYANNTVYCTSSGSQDILDLRCATAPSPFIGTGAITFHDNITVTTLATGGGSPQGRLGLTSGFVTLCDFNCFFATNGNFNAMWALSSVAQNSLTAWRTTGFDTHSINTNPVFASSIVPGAGPAQFQLGSGSPCIGTGTGGVNMGAWDGTVTQIGCDF